MAKIEKDNGPISFLSFPGGSGNKPILELCGNGDIKVKGKLVENDKAVVEGIREFLEEGRQASNKANSLLQCPNCEEMVEPVIMSRMCPECNCDKL